MSDENDAKIYCPAHLQHKKDILGLEDSVRKLWTRWDWLMGLFVFNMAGIIMLLLKAYVWSKPPGP